MYLEGHELCGLNRKVHRIHTRQACDQETFVHVESLTFISKV